jgi:hypothetical protein
MLHQRRLTAENAENAEEEPHLWKNQPTRAWFFSFAGFSNKKFFSAFSVFSAVNCFFFAREAIAQRPVRDPAPKVAIEARADVIVSKVTAAHTAVGFTVKTGTYLRSGVDAGLGATRDGISGRIDFVNRFHLDPFRQFKWAPYAGGGLGVRFDDNRKERVYALVFLGLDGPVRNGLGTSFEAGLGGGGRIGMIIRRAAAERR